MKRLIQYFIRLTIGEPVWLVDTTDEVHIKDRMKYNAIPRPSGYGFLYAIEDGNILGRGNYYSYTWKPRKTFWFN